MRPLLKPVPKGHAPAEGGIWLLRPFFRAFDRLFYAIRNLYLKLVARSLRKRLRYLFLFVLIVAGTGYLFLQMPSAYLPDEDQGMLMCQALLPANATIEQTQEVLRKMQDYFLEEEKEAVEMVMMISGVEASRARAELGHGLCPPQGLGTSRQAGPEGGCRGRPGDGPVFPVQECHGVRLRAARGPQVGQAKGFDFQLLDRGGVGHEQLMAARNQLLGMAAQNPVLTKVRPNGLEDVPEYHVEVDWEKAGTLGVPITAIHNTISAAFGSAYVNDFIQGGRVKRVYLQADAPYRMLPQDLERLYVRNMAGTMVPFSSFATGHWTSGSPNLTRFNGFPSLNIVGEAAPGRSSGEAMAAMEESVRALPQGLGFDWTGLSYQERQAGSQAAPLAFSSS